MLLDNYTLIGCFILNKYGLNLKEEMGNICFLMNKIQTNEANQAPSGSRYGKIKQFTHETDGCIIYTASSSSCDVKPTTEYCKNNACV